MFVDTRSFDLERIDLSTVRLGNRAGRDTPLATRNNGSYEATFTPSQAIFQFDRERLLANGDLPDAAGTTTLYLTGILKSGGATGGWHFEGRTRCGSSPRGRWSNGRGDPCR